MTEEERALNWEEQYRQCDDPDQLRHLMRTRPKGARMGPRSGKALSGTVGNGSDSGGDTPLLDRLQYGGKR